MCKYVVSDDFQQTQNVTEKKSFLQWLGVFIELFKTATLSSVRLQTPQICQRVRLCFIKDISYTRAPIYSSEIRA